MCLDVFSCVCPEVCGKEWTILEDSILSLAVSPLCLDICSPHTNKLDGVMPRVLHGPKAVQ